MEATVQGNNRLQYILKSALFCVVFTGMLVVFSFAKSFFPDSVERPAHGIIGTICAFLATIIFLRVDKKKFSDIGLTFDRSTVAKFIAGFLVGVVIMGLLAMSSLYMSGLKVELKPAGGLMHFLMATMPLIPLAFMEELAFRAYPLETIKSKLGIWPSILITSILFALYHLVNGWTIERSFLGPAIWGLIFGLAAIYSKGIAMPTGIHYAANLTTSAFASENNTTSIWIINHAESMASGNYSENDLVKIVPNLALLIFAILCIELYIRRRNAIHGAW